MVSQTLQTADPAPEYESLHPVKAHDLRHPRVAEQFRDAILAQLRHYGDKHELFVVLTGGRTSMAAAAMLAVQRYTLEKPKAAATLSLFHLEVTDEQLEERGTISRLLAMTREQEKRYYLNPPETAVKLVQLPALILEREPKHLWARLFEYATGSYLLDNPNYEKLRYNFCPTYLAQPGLGEVDLYAERFVAGTITEIEKVDHPQLRGLMGQAFNLSELETLCFDLKLRADEFRPTLSLFIIDLISYLERRGRLPELIAYGERERPQYNWRATIQLREVLLCECKLRTGDDPRWKPIEVEIVDKLARKIQAVMQATGRPVQGWIVSNTPYARGEALTRARETGIFLYQAQLPENWKKQNIWQIEGDLQEMTAAPTDAAA